jgi:hypothetical protein
LTLRELNLRAEAFGEREQGEWQRTAWLAAHVINMFAEEPVTPNELLNPPKRMTPDEKEEAFKELWSRHENDRDIG